MQLYVLYSFSHDGLKKKRRMEKSNWPLLGRQSRYSLRLSMYGYGTRRAREDARYHGIINKQNLIQQLLARLGSTARVTHLGLDRDASSRRSCFVSSSCPLK